MWVFQNGLKVSAYFPSGVMIDAKEQVWVAQASPYLWL